MLERLKEKLKETKERYYETLENSSQGWHEGKHDHWPLIKFLLYILKSEREDVVEVLLKAGANVNAKDSDGDTALLIAMKREDDDKVKLLKKFGAN